MPYSEALEAFWHIASSKSECVTFGKHGQYENFPPKLLFHKFFFRTIILVFRAES